MNFHLNLNLLEMFIPHNTEAPFNFVHMFALFHPYYLPHTCMPTVTWSTSAKKVTNALWMCRVEISARHAVLLNASNPICEERVSDFSNKLYIREKIFRFLVVAYYTILESSYCL